MYSPIDQIADERREWRQRKAPFFIRELQRDTKVNRLCEETWIAFCAVLHREVVLHNSLGKPSLGIRRTRDSLEVYRAVKLNALLTIFFDRQNRQIVYHSLMHQGSVLIGEDGGIAAGVPGTLLLLDLEGHLRRLGCTEAARYLSAPIMQA